MPSQFVLDTGVLDTDLLGPVVIVEASATLGGLSWDANSLVTHNAVASANLGSLLATARAADTISASANADLGALVSNADTIPQTPSVAGTGGGVPNFIQPNFPPLPKPEVIEVSTVVASASSSLGLVNASAMATITFSILEDDAELLLLI